MKRLLTFSLVLAWALRALAGNAAPVDCDLNGDGRFDVGDVVYLISCVTTPSVAFPAEVNQQFANMVDMEPGVYDMGASWEQKRFAQTDERPLHEVTLAPFRISKYEVTQALWQCVMGSNPSANVGDDLPVENVTHDECVLFADQLRRLTGISYRLPTEAEWEYAARGSVNSENYVFCGGEDPFEVAWFMDNAGGHTHPVGMLQPNEKGLYDMGGNVAEWVFDYYAPYPSSHATNPTGPARGNKSVVRGGSYADPEFDCRPSRRKSMHSILYAPTVGMRLVIDVEECGFTPEYIIHCDLNGDGRVNVSDISILVNKLLE